MVGDGGFFLVIVLVGWWDGGMDLVDGTFKVVYCPPASVSEVAGTGKGPEQSRTLSSRPETLTSLTRPVTTTCSPMKISMILMPFRSS